MNRVDFIKALAAELSEKVRPSEIHQLINYYDEMIEDLMEEGYTEEEAVTAWLSKRTDPSSHRNGRGRSRDSSPLSSLFAFDFSTRLPIVGQLIVKCRIADPKLFNNHLVCAFHHWHDWCHYVYRWDRQRCLKSHADGGWFLSLFKSVRCGDFLIWFRAALPDRHF